MLEGSRGPDVGEGGEQHQTAVRTQIALADERRAYSNQASVRFREFVLDEGAQGFTSALRASWMATSTALGSSS